MLKLYLLIFAIVYTISMTYAINKKETPWMNMSVYRDSVEIFMNGKKTFLRNSQTIYNRKYLITIKKLDNDSTGSGELQHTGVAKFDK